MKMRFKRVEENERGRTRRAGSFVLRKKRKVGSPEGFRFNLGSSSISTFNLYNFDQGRRAQGGDKSHLTRAKRKWKAKREKGKEVDLAPPPSGLFTSSFLPLRFFFLFLARGSLSALVVGVPSSVERSSDEIGRRS